MSEHTQGPILAPEHKGMRVSYSGLLSEAHRVAKRFSPGHAEMLRQLQGHLKELGQRYYAGDAACVDEFLQLYSVEREARTAVAKKVADAA